MAKPTILYSPKNGITMPYSAALAGMAPEMVALTHEEYNRIVGGRTATEAKKDTAMEKAEKKEAPAPKEEKAEKDVPPAPKEESAPAPTPQVATIDTVPDEELLDFCKAQGLDFSDLYDMAETDAERADALKAIRKKAARDLARKSRRR